MLFHFISNHFLPSLFFLTELIDRSLDRDKMKTVSVNEIEFLNLDSAVTEQEKSFLYNCIKAQKGKKYHFYRHPANYLCRGSTPWLVQEAVADSQERAVLQPCRPPGGRAPVLTGGHAVLNGDAGEGSEPV